MVIYCRRFLIRALSLSALILALPTAYAANYEFVGCYTGGGAQQIKNPHVSMSLWATSQADFDSRLRMCLNFCTSGNAPAKADFINIKEGGFPHRYAGYNAGNWCYCGGELIGTAIAPTASSKDRCGQNLNVYRPVDGTVTPPTNNQPPRAPTVNPGSWDPPFPVGLEGAIQLTWQDNGDPDGDPMSFWIEIWWWNAAETKWVMLTAEWAHLGNYTLTTDRGLVPNIYYMWRVAAVDWQKRSNPWFTYSGFSQFKTVP